MLSTPRREGMLILWRRRNEVLWRSVHSFFEGRGMMFCLVQRQRGDDGLYSLEGGCAHLSCEGGDDDARYSLKEGMLVLAKKDRR